jgi:hypothetical protein
MLTEKSFAPMENYTKNTRNLCGKNVAFLRAKVGGICKNSCTTLKVLYCSENLFYHLNH